MSKAKEIFRKFKSEIAFGLLMLFISIAIMEKIVFLSVMGTSMEPTYKNGAKIIATREKTPERDLLIVFNADESWSPQGRPFLKRIIGIPGDVIELKNGVLYVNGESEREYKANDIGSMVITLSDNEYFVLGDNTDESNDSLNQLESGNIFFTVKDSDIIVIGKELFKFGGR